jgi:Mrp family chromosome partitioning ATPase
VDAAEQLIVPYHIDGLYVVTMASHYGENPAVLWDEPTLIRAMRELNTLVKWPPLDYLFLDSPPSSSKFMQELYDCLPDLYGIVLVFQPSDIAVADLVRTIDFIRIKKAPVIGLVSNMAICISPKGERFWPYLSPKVDIGSICEEHGIPILGEVPLTPLQAKVDAELDKIADRIENTKPKVLTDDLATRLCKAIARQAVEKVIRGL